MNALKKIKERETDVGTRFVQMRTYDLQDMQNGIFHYPPSPVRKSQRIEKIGNKALQLCWALNVCACVGEGGGCVKGAGGGVGMVAVSHGKIYVFLFYF